VTDVVLYFQVHQPWRLARYTVFDVGESDRWFDDPENARLCRRVADRCYRPATEAIARLVARTGGEFRCAFSVSGTAIDQMEAFAPDALESFRALAREPSVEILGETSHHSLACVADAAEFRRQVRLHRAKVLRTFGRSPTTFRNTELVLDDGVLAAAESLGFRAALGEGADRLLGRRSPHRVHRARGCPRIRILLRHYRLSDDVAFRFGARDWQEWPLSPAKFARWLDGVPRRAQVVGLFMDFETLGEHQPATTGIFQFLEDLPDAVARHRRLRFSTPAQAARRRASSPPLAFPGPVSWADAERDLSAWLGNSMQRAAHEALYDLLPWVLRAGDRDLLERWRRLSTSDHFYYMCTKWASDGDVHRYFSPYATPHDAHLTFMNVLDDLARRADAPPPPEPGGRPARPARARRPRSSPRPLSLRRSVAG
jgi:alpha-amylase